MGVNAPHAPSVHEPAVCFSMCVWLYVWSVNCRHGISSKWYKHILQLRIKRKQPDVCRWENVYGNVEITSPRNEENSYQVQCDMFRICTIIMNQLNSARTSRSGSWRHTIYDVCAHRYHLLNPALLHVVPYQTTLRPSRYIFL